MIRIFLDVDGVLNAVRPARELDKGIFPEDWGDWDVKVCDTYPICHSRNMGKRLESLFSRDDVEIIWLTTWQDKANTHIGPLFGWDDFDHEEHVHGSHYPSDDMWWKLLVIERYLDEDPQPFVWLDDDIRYSERAHDLLRESTSNLGIAPHTAHGLTEEHLDMIEKFIQEHE